MKGVLFVLGYIWALPATVAGLLLALIIGQFRQVEGGAFQFVARPFALWIMYRAGVGAFTWGGCTVFALQRIYEDAPSRRHELRHFAQARCLGVLIPLVYGVCSIVALIRGGSAYFDNALEVDARKAE